MEDYDFFELLKSCVNGVLSNPEFFNKFGSGPYYEKKVADTALRVASEIERRIEGIEG